MRSTYSRAERSSRPRIADTLDGWVDDAEFPAPSLGEHTYWYQQVIGYDGWQDPDQLAVKMFYFFTWP